MRVLSKEWRVLYSSNEKRRFPFSLMSISMPPVASAGVEGREVLEPIGIVVGHAQLDDATIFGLVDPRRHEHALPARQSQEARNKTRGTHGGDLLIDLSDDQTIELFDQ